MPFKKGDPNINRKGPPRKPEVELLRFALEEAKKQNNGKDFLVHFVEKAYTDTNVAIALAKKLIPDKIQGEGFGNTNIFAIINRIQQDFIQENSQPSLELDTGNPHIHK